MPDNTSTTSTSATNAPPAIPTPSNPNPNAPNAGRLIPGTSDLAANLNPAPGNNMPEDPARVSAPGTQLDPTSVRPKVDGRPSAQAQTKPSAGRGSDADVPLAASELPSESPFRDPNVAPRHNAEGELIIDGESDVSGADGEGEASDSDARAASDAAAEVGGIRQSISRVRNRDQSILALIDAMANKFESLGEHQFAYALRQGALGLLGAVSDSTPGADVVPKAAGSRHPDDPLTPANVA